MKIDVRTIMLAVVAFLIPATTLAQESWALVFEDNAITTNWADKWFLDGKEAHLENSPDGLLFRSGNGEDYHAGHAVLWTKQVFEDGVKVEYDFMRTDTCGHDAVMILYLLAEGRDEPPFKKDIFAWKELRSVPYMFVYWWGMKAAHISYATRLPGADDYIRSRAYPVTPGVRDIDDIQVDPSYDGEGLFEPFVWHHITAVKEGRQLTFTVETGGRKRTVFWVSDLYEPIDNGRIGLRQMWGRASMYKNIKVYQKR